MASSPDEAPSNGDMLPLVFSFGDDEAKPVEKSVHEKELDLWAEFDSAMGVDTIDNVDEVQVEEISEPAIESDISVFCSKGKHQYILDEEIGIRCKFCYIMELEIKYVLPSLESRYEERIPRNPSEEVPMILENNIVSRPGSSGSANGECP